MSFSGAEPILAVRSVGKSFPPAVQALCAVDFDLVAGEVHALLGENGAGKSTLSRIIAGLQFPDTGEMRLAGARYAPQSRREAEKAGVRIVTQELNLIATLSIAENIFLDRLPNRLGFLDQSRLRKEVRPLLEQVGLAGMDPQRLAGELGIGQQQMVEIAAGLSGQCRVLILDEPTAALSAVETDLLFAQIERLRRSGVGIIYITHRLEEISRLAQRVTVLRDGQIAGTRVVADTTIPELIRLMVGRAIAAHTLSPPQPRTEPALRVENLSTATGIRQVSFAVQRGEIFGLAGLMGSGRTELLRAIFGADRKTSGAVYRGSSRTPVNIECPRDAVRAGIAFVTEDRKGQGLFLPWSVQENISMTSMRKVQTRGFIQRARERAVSEEFSKRLRIRCASVEQPVAQLSGGNQQKVVLAKWLFAEADILLFDEPTRGIDVGAKYEIYELLINLAGSGKSVLVVSSELPELLMLCHRIGVLCRGRLAATFNRAEFDPARIMAAAFGGV